MKYIVENAVRDAAQIAGIEPYDPNIKDDYVEDYIEADSEDEAIELAIDYLIEDGCCFENERAERTEHGIIFYRDDEPVLECFAFRATVYNGQ